MVILQIILGIIIIAAVVAIIAFILDLFHKSSHKPYGPYERFVKRPLDAFLATGALIVFSPILLITAILIRIKLGAPILFSQDRPGRDEKIFKIYKFRSMTDEKDEKGKLLPDEKRLTAFGQLLRSTSLDELPELFNIIKGDMAVIGPRPLRVSYLPWYSEEQAHRHDVRPGLTGYAQVHGRNTVDWDDKFCMDVNYLTHITFLGDCKIILDTIKTVLKREGINSDNSVTMESIVDYSKSKGLNPTLIRSSKREC